MNYSKNIKYRFDWLLSNIVSKNTIFRFCIQQIAWPVTIRSQRTEMARSLAIVSLLLCLHLTFGDDLYEGDPCQVAGSGARGTCKLLEKCPAAIQELMHSRYPAHCGWDGGLEIVCCQNPPSTKPPTRPPTTPDRISAMSKCQTFAHFSMPKLMTIHLPSFRVQRVRGRCLWKNLGLDRPQYALYEKDFALLVIECAACGWRWSCEWKRISAYGIDRLSIDFRWPQIQLRRFSD